MLSAILNGKGRRLPDTLAPGASLRMAFTRSEDILTATVFERLAYLDGPDLWAVLSATFRPAFLPPRRVVELDSIEFWPTWGQARETLGKAVEPDVVLRLTTGDPPVGIVLIVESKLAGTQYAAQWAEEWIAHHAEIEDGDKPGEVWLLALGGLPMAPEQTVSTFTDAIRRDRPGVEIKAAAGDWLDLMRALGKVDTTKAITRRIVADVKAALELHGFKNFRAMEDLIHLADASNVTNNYAPLRWKQEPSTLKITIEGFSDFAERTSKLRPIMENQRLRWDKVDG